jgi:hypothetical protein
MYVVYRTPDPVADVRGALGQRRGPDPNSRTSALLAGIPGRGRKSRSDRLPEFILGGPPEPPGPAEEHVHGHADKRVLRDPLTLSPALAVKRPADPGQLVKLVGPQAEFLALKALPFRSL